MAMLPVNEWQLKSKLDFILEKLLFVKYFWDNECDNINKDVTEKILHTVVNSIFMHFARDAEQNLIRQINIHNYDDLFEPCREFMLAVITNDQIQSGAIGQPLNTTTKATCNQNILSCLNPNIFNSQVQH